LKPESPAARASSAGSRRRAEAVEMTRLPRDIVNAYFAARP
jgi:hypothetical protein